MATLAHRNQPIQDDHAARPDLRALLWTVDGTIASCRADLRIGGQRAEGRAIGHLTNGGRIELPAGAVAEALREASGQAVDARIQAIRLVEIGGYHVVAAVVGEGGGTSAGAVLVRSDATVAAARAVLDAVNRRFGRS